MLAQFRQRAPDFGLEDDDESDCQVDRNIPQYPAQHVQVHHLCKPGENRQQEGQPDQHLGATRAAEEKENVVVRDP